MSSWNLVRGPKNIKQESLLMQTEPCEHTVSWYKHNSRNRLRPDVVDSSRPISLRHRKRIVGVGHSGRTQCCGGTASERQSCSVVEITRFEPTHLYLAPPLWVMSLEFRQDFWRRKTRVPGLSYFILSVILGLAVFVQLRLVTDRQTDGRTDRHTMTANTVLA